MSAREETPRLAEVIARNGFVYRLDRRNKFAYLYKQMLNDRIIGYEVFLAVPVKRRRIGKKEIPAHDRFPGNNDFGIFAFAYTADDYAQALIKFGELTGKAKALKKNKY